MTIRGRVQGVGFRASLQHEAMRRKLCGWVRNRLDGSVEALVCGEGSAVDDFLAWAAHGPPGARVVEINTVELDALPDVDGAQTFEMRPTI